MFTRLPAVDGRDRIRGQRERRTAGKTSATDVGNPFRAGFQGGTATGFSAPGRFPLPLKTW
ncbi:MAG: hypothetical protein CW346_09905 [Bacillaceae bacterium]|nr:hypothetical protein [Bacillaceae bacterium]